MRKCIPLYGIDMIMLYLSYKNGGCSFFTSIRCEQIPTFPSYVFPIIMYTCSKTIKSLIYSLLPFL